MKRPHNEHRESFRAEDLAKAIAFSCFSHVLRNDERVIDKLAELARRFSQEPEAFKKYAWSVGQPAVLAVDLVFLMVELGFEDLRWDMNQAMQAFFPSDDDLPHEVAVLRLELAAFSSRKAFVQEAKTGASQYWALVQEVKHEIDWYYSYYSKRLTWYQMTEEFGFSEELLKRGVSRASFLLGSLRERGRPRKKDYVTFDGKRQKREIRRD